MACKANCLLSTVLIQFIGSVAIEFIWYNSQLLVQHLYVFPWGSIDRFVGASQHNVKKRVHTGYCNLFHFANDIVH